MKVVLFCFYQACFYRSQAKNVVHKLILFGQVVLMVYTEIPIIHSSLFGEGNMEFLPIMLISVYTGVGLIYCYLEFIGKVVLGKGETVSGKKKNK